MKIIERDTLIALGFDYATADNLSALTDSTGYDHSGLGVAAYTGKTALAGQLATASAIIRLAKALEAYVTIASAGR